MTKSESCYLAYWFRAFSKLRRDLSKLPVSVFTCQGITWLLLNCSVDIITMVHTDIKSKGLVHLHSHYVRHLFFALLSAFGHLRIVEMIKERTPWVASHIFTSLTLLLISLATVFPIKVHLMLRIKRNHHMISKFSYFKVKVYQKKLSFLILDYKFRHAIQM